MIQLYILTFFLKYFPLWFGASLVAQLVKNLPAVQETWVGDLGLIPGLGRSPGEGKCCSHSNILAWIFPWTIQSMGSQRVPTVAQRVKHLPAMQETQVRFLGQEDPLEKGMATHSSILAWRIPWAEEPGGHSHAITRAGHNDKTATTKMC